MTYHRVQKALHWLVALCVLGLIPIGMIIEGYDPKVVEQVDATLGKGGFNTIYDLHKSVGITVLGLMILRVIARVTLGKPDYDPPLTPFESAASRIVHGLLYVLLILTPIVGWIGVSAYPAPAPFFFLFDVALPVGADRPLSEFLLQDVHGPAAMMILFLSLAHIAAAFKHWLINRDGVMRRMTG